MGDEPDKQAIVDAKAYDVDAKLVELKITPEKRYGNKLTLFNGQWADLSIDEMASFAHGAGFDGLELCTWGKSLDLDVMLGGGGTQYIKETLATLKKHDIGVWAMSSHIQGQAATNANASIDVDLMGFLPERYKAAFDNGDYDAVRKAGVDILANTVRAAAKLRDVAAKEYSDIGPAKWNPSVVTMFTGSPIWHRVYLFPGMDDKRIQAAFDSVAEAMKPVLKVADAEGINLGLEVHPTEIAFDGHTANRLLDSMAKVQYGERFGVNNDASHLGYQGVDPVKFIEAMGARERLYHSHIKDAAWGLDPAGLGGVHGSHEQFGSEKRYWDFRSIARGMINQAAIVEALTQQGYKGPLSVEWEDPRIKREAGAIASAKVMRGILTGNVQLAKEGLQMYKNPANYERAAFDKAFTE